MRHPTIDIQIAPRFLAAVRPPLPPRNVGIIMILMDRASHLSDVNHRSAVKQRIFNQPLIKPRAAKSQSRHVRIYVSSKYKSIDCSVMARDTGREKFEPQRSISFEIEMFSKINFPPLSDSQKL